MVTLEKVLKSLQEGETGSAESLARAMEGTPEAVLAALSLLESMGKVHRVYVSAHCGHGCKGCASPCSGQDVRTASGMSRQAMSVWELVQ